MKHFQKNCNFLIQNSKPWEFKPISVFLGASDLNSEKGQNKKGKEMNHDGLFSCSFSLPKGSWSTFGFR